MQRTVPRGYQYPECNPPLVEDASDIARGLAGPAFQIDIDVTAQFDTIDNNLLTPDGCELAASVAQTIEQGDTIQFNISRFDNTPGFSMSETGGIRIATDGLYLVTGGVQVNTITVVGNLKVVFGIEGVGEVSQNGLGSSLNNFQHVSGSMVLRLFAGQLLTLSARTNNVNTLPVSFAQVAVARVVSL